MIEKFPNLERPSLQDAIANVEELFEYYRRSCGTEPAAMLVAATVLEENLTLIANHIEDLQRAAE